MAESYEQWLTVHLGAMIDHELDKRPEVTANYHKVFQKDPVATQYLASAAVAAPVAMPPASGEVTGNGGPAAHKAPGAHTAPGAAADVEIELLSEDEVLSQIQLMLDEEIVPGLIEEFGAQELQDNFETVTAEVSAALAAKLDEILGTIAVQAQAGFTTVHATQGED